MLLAQEPLRVAVGTDPPGETSALPVEHKGLQVTQEAALGGGETTQKR